MIAVQQPLDDTVTYTWSPVTKLAEERQVLREDGLDTTSYLWDNQNVIREITNDTTIEVDYTYQPQAHGDLISQRRDSTTSIYHYDALGSEIALTQGGVVSDEDRYQAFGQSTSQTGTTTNPYQWIGQQGYYADPETNQHSLHARQYNTTQSRFTSEDPLGFNSGESNFYRYVANNPVGQIDPAGTRAFDINIHYFFDSGEVTGNLPEIKKYAEKKLNECFDSCVAKDATGKAPKSGYQGPPVSPKGVQPVEVKLSELQNPPSKLVADPAKLARHGAFDPKKADPITVEIVGKSKRKEIVEGVTRAENARRAGFTTIWAYIFKRE